MAQPVWVLSVDLQAKTATFQTGMSDAARSARGAFDEIGGAAGSGGRRVSGGMMEARHSVMMLGEEFGVHLPRALTSFIAGLGPIGGALEAAFPFLAVALGATLLIEHLVKLHDAGVKLSDDQMNFGTAANNAFNQLDAKLLESQKRTDELRNDHLGALNKELEIIDRQSMEELVKSFEEVAKAADVVMKDLEGQWYTFGKGSEGAKHALDEFQMQYGSLLAQGKDGDASGLLTGTLGQAQKALGLLQQVQSAGRGSNPFGAFADPAKFHAAADELQRMGIAFNPDHVTQQVAAQQQLVDALQDQVHLEGQIAALKKQDSANAKTQTGNEQAGMNAAAGRQSADSRLRMGQQAIAADKATTDAQLEIHRSSLEDRLKSDVDFAGRERDVQLAGNAAEAAALDKSGKDYTNQLKAMQDKALEINSEYNTKVAELNAKSSVEIADRDLQALEQGEREKIEATQQGSAARLSAINTAIKQEEAAHLQDTNFYRELLTQRVEALRQETEEEGKQRENAGKEEAANIEKTGALTVAAEKQSMALIDSARHVSMQTRIQQETQIANEEYQIKLKAAQTELAALDKTDKDYENKLKQQQDKEKQITQQHVTEIAKIKETAEEEQSKRILASEGKFQDAMASGLTKTLMGHQSFTKMMNTLGEQVVSGMMQNAIKSILANKMTQESDAKAAAAAAFKNGEKVPVIGPILGPIYAAAAFAGVMAFAGGTDSVPGVGLGDVVPAMLTPTEGVVPGGVMDGLRKMARSGNLGNTGNTTHVHAHFAPTIHALDADGVERVLDKHADTFQRHFEKTVRKMNH